MIVNWNTEVFDPRAANALGEAALLAYQDAKEIERVIKEKWKMEMVQPFFDEQETQAFLARTTKEDGAMILAFRGTESLKDWMSDVDIHLVNGPVGKVHEGFQCALNTVWRTLWKFLNDKFVRGQRSLWITGHSLGAALATLATAKIRLEQGHPVSGLYTFGCPRVGNDEFSRAFDQDFWAKTYRFVNNNDVVPRIPFRLLNYRHVGTFKYFDHTGKVNDKITWDKILLDRIQGHIDDLLEPNTDGIKDHQMTRYVDNLKRLLRTGRGR